MMLTNRSISVFLVSASFYAMSTTLSNAQLSESAKKDVAAAFLKFGVSVGSTLAPHIKEQIFPLREDEISEHRAAIDKALSPYIQRRKRSDIFFGLARSYTTLVIEGSAAAAASTGVGAVPALIGRTIAHTSMDAFWGAAERSSRKGALKLLKAAEPELKRIAGGNIDSLRSLGPDELRSKIANQTTIFQQIRSSVGGDKDTQDRITTLAFETLRATSQATLDHVEANAGGISENVADIKKLDTNLLGFTEKVEKQFSEHAILLGKISTETQNLGKSVEQLSARTANNEAATQFLLEMAYSSMSPREKATALKSGHYDSRFGGDSVAKDALITKYESEANLIELSSDISSVATGAQNIAEALTSIGVELPEELSKSVQYGVVASKAFSQFATGNYLGAVVSLTSVFKKRVDPDQERFKLMMSYLGKQFEQLNKRLDTVVELQVKTLQRVDELAKKLDDYYIDLDQRLAGIEFQLEEISQIVREQYWSSWLPCEKMRELAVRDFPEELKGKFQDFEKVDSIFEFSKGSGLISSKNCITYVDGNVSFNGNAISKGFGSLLDAGKIEGFMIEENLGGNNSSDEARISDLEYYRVGIYRPSITILRRALRHFSLPEAISIDYMIDPATDFYELERRATEAPPDGMPCDGGSGSIGYLSARAKDLLCSGNLSADGAANQILEVDIVTDFAFASADWFWIASRLGDFYDAQNDSFVDSGEVFKFARRTESSPSVGKSIARTGLNALDATVLSFPILFGEMAAIYAERVIFDGVDGGIDPLLYQLVQENEVLQQNILMAKIVKSLRNQSPRLSPSDRISYRFAYEFALSSERDRFLFMKKLIGDRKFVFDSESNRITMLIVEKTENKPEIRAYLPNPEIVSSARIIYPGKMRLLDRYRNRLIERLEGFEFVAPLSAEEIELVSTSILRAEQRR